VRSDDAIHGVLVVDKAVGPTSHDVVACARRALKLSRIGHTGTLDPQASGVLPLVLGQATRLAQYLTGSDKEYEAIIRFGLETDTYDAAGTVVRETGAMPSEAAIRDALWQFTGPFAQSPPPYSAKMLDGARSYELARAGTPVQAPAVPVAAHVVELQRIDGPRAWVRVRCSAGFYIRSLAHDLGQALGTGAILDTLVRTEAAGFGLADSVPFDILVTAPRAELLQRVRPMESLLLHVPGGTLTDQGVQWALHGRELGPHGFQTPPPVAPLLRLLAPHGALVGLGKPGSRQGFVQPTVVFKYN
jgi:tRNA pseudouridine55 synthase